MSFASFYFMSARLRAPPTAEGWRLLLPSPLRDRPHAVAGGAALLSKIGCYCPGLTMIVGRETTEKISDHETKYRTAAVDMAA